MTQIKNIRQLNRVLKDCRQHIFRIVLKGSLYSRKTIWLNPHKDEYRVTNHIDDTFHKLNRKQLFNKDYTNIGAAMLKGSLIWEDEQEPKCVTCYEGTRNCYKHNKLAKQ